MRGAGKVIFHLCSGSGGDSEAFAVHPDWKVFRFDNNPELSLVPHTHILDITQWMDWIEQFPTPDVIIAGPDCTQYSTLSTTRDPENYDLTVPRAVKDIIEHFNPEWWVVENVRGANAPFTELFGRVNQVVGPFWFWGKFPWLNVVVEWKGRSARRLGHKVIRTDEPGNWVFNGVPYSKWETQQNAAVPIQISSALLESIETHISLEDFV